MTTVLETDGNFTDTSLPKWEPDPLLIPGTLLLWEAAHPDAPLAGIPADGASLTNLAADIARTAIPTGDLSIPFARGSDSTYLKRTPKGGFQVKGRTNAAQRAAGRFPVALATYMMDTAPTHNYYISAWCGLWSATSVTAGRYVELCDQTSPSAAPYKAVANMQMGGSGGYLSGSYATNALGPKLIANAAVPGLVGERTPATAQAVSRIFGNLTDAGNPVPNASDTSAMVNFWYRVTIHDLTVSGLTAAQVYALDQAEYAARVTTEGGRYYGDAAA